MELEEQRDHRDEGGDAEDGDREGCFFQNREAGVC